MTSKLLVFIFALILCANATMMPHKILPLS